MTIQELIEKLNAAVDGAIVLAEQWYNGAAPVSNRDNNDNWCNLMDARRHLADLADRIAELIRKYNALCLENTPLRMKLEMLNNSLDQTLAEIANLREQVRVRDEAMRWLAVELSNSIDLNEHYAAKMEDLNTPRPATMWSKKPMGGSAPMSPHGKKRIEELIKAALDAAKEGKDDGSN